MDDYFTEDECYSNDPEAEERDRPQVSLSPIIKVKASRSIHRQNRLHPLILPDERDPVC